MNCIISMLKVLYAYILANVCLFMNAFVKAKKVCGLWRVNALVCITAQTIF